MAMNTPAKLWVRVSLLVSVGLLVVARRTLEAVPGLAKALTAIAVIAFLGGLGAQVWRWAKATHKRKQAETTLLACFLGLLAAGDPRGEAAQACQPRPAVAWYRQAGRRALRHVSAGHGCRPGQSRPGAPSRRADKGRRRRQGLS